MAVTFVKQQLLSVETLAFGNHLSCQGLLVFWRAGWSQALRTPESYRHSPRNHTPAAEVAGLQAAQGWTLSLELTLLLPDEEPYCYTAACRPSGALARMLWSDGKQSRAQDTQDDPQELVNDLSGRQIRIFLGMQRNPKENQKPLQRLDIEARHLGNCSASALCKRAD